MYDEEDVVVGDGGEGGARGIRRALNASAMKTGEAGEGVSMFRIVTFCGDPNEYDELVDHPGWLYGCDCVCWAFLI